MIDRFLPVKSSISFLFKSFNTLTQRRLICYHPIIYVHCILSTVIMGSKDLQRTINLHERCIL